jgi:RNA polymerase sigma-70 factor (ECF subfamily)
LALEKKIALESSLASLPEESRRVIDLRHTQGQTFAEIGAALGKSAEAARKVWFRALGKLRQELKRHEEFGSSCWKTF